MSTAPISASPEAAGLASKSKAIDWLFEQIEGDGDICNNCFGERDLDREFFRISGGTNDHLTDRFCSCGSGTGKAGREPQSSYDTSTRGFEGTVDRRWPDGSLPIRDDSGLSEMQLMKNLVIYLDTHTDYEVQPDVDTQLDVMARKSQNRPTENVKLLKVGLWLVLTPGSRRQLRKDAAQA